MCIRDRFAVVILFDILGHRNMKIKRNLLDWIFLCLLGVGLAGTLIFNVGRLIKANSGERPGLYLAYRYLMDGDSDNALSLIHIWASRTC